MSRITVIGAGYVGLTTAAYLAHLGHDVTCSDVDASKVETLGQGIVPIHEPGLTELVVEGLANKRLVFTNEPATAATEAEFAFLCVPTPQGEDGSADLSYVQAAAEQVGPVLPAGCIVINKSTVPVGSVDVVAAALGRSDVDVVSNPEFLREGSAVHDCLNPKRIVIGGADKSACQKVAGLFEKLDAPVLITDAASAETIKYAANTFLATKVSFINAMANVCEAVGANIEDVALAMGYDPRIGFNFLQAGPGWGGSCLPKDSKAFLRIAEDAGYDFHLLRSVVAVNDEQYEMVARKIRNAAGGSVAGKTIAVWGLAFKADTDDMRDSPSLFVIDKLIKEGARVVAYDPTQPTADQMPGIELAEDPYVATHDADVLAVLTEWKQFVELDMERVGQMMTSRAVVDGRNLLDANTVREAGFTYTGIGRQ